MKNVTAVLLCLFTVACGGEPPTEEQNCRTCEDVVSSTKEEFPMCARDADCEPDSEPVVHQYSGSMFITASGGSVPLSPYSPKVRTESTSAGFLISGVCPDGSGITSAGTPAWDGRRAIQEQVVCRIQPHACSDATLTITGGSARVDGNWLVLRPVGTFHACGVDTAIEGAFDGLKDY